MKLHLGSLIDPLFMFIAAMIVGSLWLLRPIPIPPTEPPTPAPAVVVVPRIPAPEHKLAPLKKPARPDPLALKTELAEASIAVQERASNLAALNAEIELLERQVEALRAEVAALEAKRASMRTPTKTHDPSEESHLETLIKQRQQTARQLEQRLEGTHSAGPALIKGPPRVVAVEASGELPVLVELIGNRISPVTRDFFHFPALALSPEMVVTRSRPGETIAEARQPNSRFAHFLKKLQHGSVYISCLLNSDSFEAFYAVREMATRAGFEIAWEPAYTSKGEITIQRVKLVWKPNSKTVRVPDIVRQAPDPLPK